MALAAGLYTWSSTERGTPPGDALEKLTIAVPNTMLSVLVLVAHETRLFRKHGLEVTLQEYPIGANALAAMVAGKADVAVTATRHNGRAHQERR